MFHSILWGTSASAPRIWHSKCRGRCQPFGANTKIGYMVGNWHSSPSLRKETTDYSFLKTATTSCIHIQDFHRSIKFESKIAPPPQLAITEGEDRSFRWGLLNTEISFRLPSLRLLLSMRSWIKLGQRSFPISPFNYWMHYWMHISPIQSQFLLPTSLLCLRALFRLVVDLFVPL